MSRASDRRVLVLDGDTPQSLAIVRALGRRGVHVDVGASVQDSLSRHSKYTAAALLYPDPMVDGDAFVDAIGRRVASTRYDLVIPVTEDSVHPLARRRADIERYAPLAIAPNEALATVTNKDRTFELADRLGVPIPKGETYTSIEPIEAVASSLRYPVVLKPSRSVAAKDGDIATRLSVRYAHDAEDLIDEAKGFLAYGPLLLQEYFRGTGVGIELLADHGEVVYAFQHKRLHEMPLTGGGSSLRQSVPIDDTLLDYSRRLIDALGWHGVAMVEFKLDEATGESRLMEINGRFWGSLPLCTAAGADFPSMLFDLYVNNERPDPAARAKTGVVCRKLSSDAWWYIEVLRRSDPEPLIQWPSRGQALLDALRVLSLDHAFDVQSIDDLRPGAIDAWRTVQDVSGRFTSMLSHRLVRRRMTAVKKRGLQSELQSARSIVFGCYGNINRSLLAERHLRSVIPGASKLRIESAGFHAKTGRPADRNMAALARSRGLSLDDAASQRYTAAMIDDADLVFVMEIEHITRLLEEFPDAKSKTFLLGCLNPAADADLEISDPYGDDADGYVQIFDEVTACTTALARKLS